MILGILYLPVIWLILDWGGGGGILECIYIQSHSWYAWGMLLRIWTPPIIIHGIDILSSPTLSMRSYMSFSSYHAQILPFPRRLDQMDSALVIWQWLFWIKWTGSWWWQLVHPMRRLCWIRWQRLCWMGWGFVGLDRALLDQIWTRSRPRRDGDGWWLQQKWRWRWYSTNNRMMRHQQIR